ncbi:hypothetical protein [Actinophytocola sp. NPDC049390]|uniref:hypothetical protein n=1 Tax=Actinophytocola sp. NPDC049390 TaxID=3363894 RepID=UPI00378EF2F1
MPKDVLDGFTPSFPTRFRGYDRDAVDHEVRELRSALRYAHEERDRAVTRALALETTGGQDTASASTTVQWLIDSAEQDAARIRAEAEEAAQQFTEQAEDQLRRRVELVEEAQREADTCRALAAEEARQIVHDALDKASALLRGLQESEASLREMFGSGGLHHRMPPPRRSDEQQWGQHATAPLPAPESVERPGQHAAAPLPSPEPLSDPVVEPLPAPLSAPPTPAAAGVPQHVPAVPPVGPEPLRP